LLQNLVIFLRKNLFSGQDTYTQIGIIAATHVLHEDLLVEEGCLLLIIIDFIRVGESTRVGIASFSKEQNFVTFSVSHGPFQS